MNAAIDITEEQRKILVGLLHRYLLDVEVWAYGSRVRWTAHPNSDLDLVAFAPPGLQSKVAELKDALAESDLPFLVDLHIWEDVPKRFHEIIRKEYVVLQERKGELKPLDIVHDWTAMRLGSVTRFTSGGTPSKQNAAYWSGCIPWLSAKDMKSFYIDDTEDHISAEGLDNGSRLAPAGTVFLLARGMTLLNDVPICVSRRPMAFNQDVKGLIADEELLIPEFLPYLLLGHKDTLLDLVDLAGHGTGRLNTDELKSLSISVPPKAEQRLIANILRSVDAKIELNRKMNDTLEATAQALFKSWFVNFDPVRAKAEGRDPGLPASIAALFPDSFEDSELGEIPKGWKTSPLPGLIEVNPARPLRKGELAPYLDMANMPTVGHSADEVKMRAFGSGMRFVNGDTLVARITPCLENGKTAFVDFLGEGQVGWGSTEYIIFRPMAPMPNEFAYCLARSAEFRDFAIQSMTGSSGRQHVPAESLRHFLMVAPPTRVLEKFGLLIKPLFARITAAARESRSLKELRDALLPKLISGQIRLKQAEHVIVEAFR